MLQLPPKGTTNCAANPNTIFTTNSGNVWNFFVSKSDTFKRSYLFIGIHRLILGLQPAPSQFSARHVIAPPISKRNKCRVLCRWPTGLSPYTSATSNSIFRHFFIPVYTSLLVYLFPFYCLFSPYMVIPGGLWVHITQKVCIIYISNIYVNVNGYVCTAYHIHMQARSTNIEVHTYKSAVCRIFLSFGVQICTKTDGCFWVESLDVLLDATEVLLGSWIPKCSPYFIIPQSPFISPSPPPLRPARDMWHRCSSGKLQFFAWQHWESRTPP